MVVYVQTMPEKEKKKDRERKQRRKKQNKPTKKKPTLLAKKFKDLSIRRNINIVGREESLHERLARHNL
jgi:hypothetical protein